MKAYKAVSIKAGKSGRVIRRYSLMHHEFTLEEATRLKMRLRYKIGSVNRPEIGMILVFSDPASAIGFARRHYELDGWEVWKCDVDSLTRVEWLISDTVRVLRRMTVRKLRNFWARMQNVELMARYSVMHAPENTYGCTELRFTKLVERKIAVSGY